MLNYSFWYINSNETISHLYKNLLAISFDYTFVLLTNCQNIVQLLQIKSSDVQSKSQKFFLTEKT